MSHSEYDALKLENQLCFPLYAAAREVVKRYRPYLDSIDLTYTQYITMMVFWEEKKMNVKALGKKLFLDLLDLIVLARNNTHAKVAHTGIASSPPLSQKLPKLEAHIQRLRNCFLGLLS